MESILHEGENANAKKVVVRLIILFLLLNVFYFNKSEREIVLSSRRETGKE